MSDVTAEQITTETYQIQRELTGILTRLKHSRYSSPARTAAIHKLREAWMWFREDTEALNFKAMDDGPITGGRLPSEMTSKELKEHVANTGICGALTGIEGTGLPVAKGDTSARGTGVHPWCSECPLLNHCRKMVPDRHSAKPVVDRS